jgi:DNA polymerase I
VSAPVFTIVDGSGYIFRAYYALKMPRGGGRKSVNIATSSGLPTGAVHVFATMLMRLYLDEKPQLCAIVFDSEEPNFRHKLDPQYKTNRKEVPEELIPQIPWFTKIARAMGFHVLCEAGVEADDVIATLTRMAREQGYDVVIYGADKDLMQLVSDHVVMVDTMRDQRFDPAAVVTKLGVKPHQVRDWLALRGDTSDNVPGVSGVGDVTASRLLQDHGSIEGILAATAQLKPKLQQTLANPVELANLERSKQLVSLRTDVEIPPIPEYRRRDWDARQLADIFRTLEFHRFLARLESTFVADRTRYRTVLDEAALDAAIAGARAAGEFAISLEMTRLDDIHAKIVGIGVSAQGLPPAYIPLGHRYLGAPAQLGEKLVLDKLRPILTDPAIKRHVHNYKLAWVVLGDRGIELAAQDVAVTAFLADPTRPPYTLEGLAKAHLDHTLLTRDEPFEETDVTAATHVGAESADVALCLARLFASRLDAAHTKLMDEIELPLARVLGQMERYGIRVDIDVLRELGTRIGEDTQRLEKQIHLLAGYPVNPGSTKQLNELLFDKLGLRGEKMRRTKTGAYSTDAEQLEELAAAHAVVPPIILHRELTKLKGTYLDALPGWVNPTTKRVHTSYSQVAATTGRLASNNPNIQNIPIRTALGKEIRRAFIPAPGFLLVSVDYSQIELRVLAHLCGDPVLVEAFARDRDVHAQTAAEVFEVPLTDVTADMRRVAKAVNYGLGYGQTEHGLARSLDIPREEARRYIETYFKRFAGVREYMDDVIKEAHKTQVVHTLLGRRIPVAGIGSARFGERSAAERFARNAPIQGSAADILKLAMLRLAKICDGTSARMLLTVHDELVFEVREDRAAELGAQAKQEMEDAIELQVPLRADVGIGKTWADAH